MANLAVILGKWLSVRLAIGIDTSIFGWLQGVALHAHDFLYSIPIERFVSVFGRHFTLLFAAETAGVHSSTKWMSQFASSSIVWAAQHGARRTIVVRWSQFTGRKQRYVTLHFF